MLSEQQKPVETWLDGLVRISRRIASIDDVDTILRDVVLISRELTRADTASLALLEAADQLVLKHQAVQNHPCEMLNVQVSSPTLWTAIKSAAAHRYPAEIEHMDLSWDCAGEIYTVDTAAIAPLYLDSVPIGLLWVGRYSGEAFNKSEIAGLGHLADQTVIALQHASMAARLQSLAVIEERSRIAREMHDSLAQILGYLGLEMQTLEMLTRQGDSEAVLAEIKQARQTIKSAQVDVRGNILSLRTTLSGNLGLIAALQTYLEEFSLQTGIMTQFIDDTNSDLALSPIAETQLVRIVQEALTNVRKHSQADVVVFHLMVQDAELIIALTDNGIGIQKGEISKSHFGLQTMVERAESIGGKLAITSSDSGTSIKLTVPLS